LDQIILESMSTCDLVYQKYEQYSVQYIVSIEQLTGFLESYIGDVENANRFLDESIKNCCYYNLITTKINDFNDKLRHNIKLAQESDDTDFLGYLQRKFAIDDDLSHVDPETWTYQSKKIKVKLKVSINKNKYMLNPKLAEFLGVSTDQTYKYRSDIYKLIHQYIATNRLQDQYNRSQVNPDDDLSKVLSPPPLNSHFYTYYNLPSCLDHMITFS
jgi:chromatin remodeling complex protein RSC6